MSVYNPVSYARGLSLTFLVMVAFAALGWLRLAEPFEGSKVILPLLMALMVWTVMYFIAHYVFGVLVVIGAATYSIGFFVGLWALGYLLLSLVVYLLPSGWVSFTDKNIEQFLMGFAFALVPILDSKFWKKVEEYINRL